MSQKDSGFVEAAIEDAIEQLGTYSPGVGDRIYHWVLGDHVEFTDGWGWTDGFWHGLLWFAFETTGDSRWRKAIASSHRRFRERLAAHETHNHDMGFLYSLSAVPEYEIEGSTDAREMALAATRSLSARFNPFGRFLRAWNVWAEDATDEAKRERRGKAIVDSMMNLQLLYWASRETGDRAFAEIANEHAETTRLLLVRKDGSTFHTYNFDPVTGEPLGGRTVQGYRDDSCWSRGQAWAMYGYALAYSWTKRPDHLETARRLTRYWVERIPADGVPRWDFDAPADGPVDTSAAAIASCGLFELSRHVPVEEAGRYRALATKTLATLHAKHRQKPSHVGLITGGVSNFNRDLAVGAVLVYGDYFYFEGLLRARGRTNFYWHPERT